ncbi:histidine kinase [Flavobacterium sp. RS13.1]|uniref:histidine kinase n=1 Tax=Flavobacterium sp. RS13.1 TaxID=3400345 RepID=UPI003AAAEE9F
MKKALILVFFTNILLSQSTVNKNPNDTLSVDAFGKKIELASNIDSIKKWNDYLLKIIRKRQKIQNLQSKIKDYYECSEFLCLITDAYYHYEKGNNQQGIQNYFYILKHANDKKYPKIVGFACSEIGSSFYIEKEFEKAMFYFKKALSIFIKENDPYQLGTIYRNLGKCYTKNNSHKLALEFFKKSLHYFSKTDNQDEIADSNRNLYEAYKTLNNKTKALPFLLQSIKIYNQTGNKYDLALPLYNLYESSEEKDLPKRNKLLALAYETAVEANNLKYISSIGAKLYPILKNEKRYKEALTVAESIAKANDSINKQGNQNAILKANFRYETEKKQNHITSLQKDNKIANLENKRQKSIVLSLSIFIFSLLIFGYFIFNRFKIKKQNELLKLRLLEAEKTILAEKKASQSELKALKSQMNPHFFFNALNTIQSYIATNETEEATDYLNKFSKLTRMILEMTDKNWISIDEEIKMQNLYLNLQKIRLSDFNFQINIKNSHIHNVTIPTMLLQPYIENAVIHGLAHKKGMKNLWVNFEINPQNQLEITIKDNGIGLTKANEINQKNTSKNTSFATKATLERLEIINRNDLKIEIETNELFDSNENSEGTEIKITMDLHYE